MVLCMIATFVCIELTSLQKYAETDMEFVKNFTHPDFQAKSFTAKVRNLRQFFRKLTA